MPALAPREERPEEYRDNKFARMAFTKGSAGTYCRLSIAETAQWFHRKHENSAWRGQTAHQTQKSLGFAPFFCVIMLKRLPCYSPQLLTRSLMELFWINRYRDGNLAIMPAPRAT